MTPSSGVAVMRVFLSYAGRDRAWAEWIAWQIEHAGRGVTVELDRWDWQAGDRFVVRMNAALDACDHMLAVLSQAYYEPERWTTEEWTTALGMAKDRLRFLIPVRVDDAPAPPLLAGLVAPALHGLSAVRARDVVLGALCSRAGDRSGNHRFPALGRGANPACQECCRRCGVRCPPATRRSPAATGC